MARKVAMSSLTVGRCFTVPQEEDPSVAESPAAANANISRSIMRADNVWRITAVDDGVATAVNALGGEETFEPTALVVEIPRQGYDRMVERVEEGDTP